MFRCKVDTNGPTQENYYRGQAKDDHSKTMKNNPLSMDKAWTIGQNSINIKNCV